MASTQDLCDLFAQAREQEKPEPNAEALASILRQRFLSEKTSVRLRIRPVFL